MYVLIHFQILLFDKYYVLNLLMVYLLAHYLHLLNYNILLDNLHLYFDMYDIYEHDLINFSLLNFLLFDVFLLSHLVMNQHIYHHLDYHLHLLLEIYFELVKSFDVSKFTEKDLKKVLKLQNLVNEYNSDATED